MAKTFGEKLKADCIDAIRDESGFGNKRTLSRTTCERVRAIVRLQVQAKAIYKEMDAKYVVLVDSGCLEHGDEIYIDRDSGTKIWTDQFHGGVVKVWKASACMRYVFKDKK